MSAAAEFVCLVLLLGYLVWVPLPFGSIVAGAFPPLVFPPIAICVVASLLRARDVERFAQPRALRIWAGAGAAFLLLIAFQLLPMPSAVLSALSPESHAIWTRADQVVLLAGAQPSAMHPITIDPLATRRELFRLLAMFATFLATALLIHDRRRRLLFAAALSIAAVFESLYGVREAALRRYAIWGWRNRLIFDRVTGTFVNPNHFAHYLAIVLPLALYVGAAAWPRHGPKHFRGRVAYMIEHHLLAVGVALLAALSCVAAMLLSQSRGALLATATGFSITAALASFLERNSDRTRSRRRRVRQIVMAALSTSAAFALLVVIIALYLGPQRTVERFRALEQSPADMVGRRVGISAAFGIWRRFPLLGSGAGTFESVVSLTQLSQTAVTYQHAHDDYAEIGATTGIAGFALAVGGLVAGIASLVRRMMAAGAHGSWRNRTFMLAAMTSIAIASTHALFDFNFFMPANAATIAAIGGAAASLRLRESGEERGDSSGVRRA